MVSIIDDDDAARDSLQIFLQCADIACRTFEHCEAYLEEAPAADDCLILDINMPGMSGLELLEVLRRRGETVPVILVTGISTPEIIDRAKASDAIAVLQKPFDPNALLRLIRSAKGQ